MEHQGPSRRRHAAGRRGDSGDPLVAPLQACDAPYESNSFGTECGGTAARRAPTNAPSVTAWQSARSASTADKALRSDTLCTLQGPLRRVRGSAAGGARNPASSPPSPRSRAHGRTTPEGRQHRAPAVVLQCIRAGPAAPPHARSSCESRLLQPPRCRPCVEPSMDHGGEHARRDQSPERHEHLQAVAGSGTYEDGNLPTV